MAQCLKRSMPLSCRHLPRKPSALSSYIYIYLHAYVSVFKHVRVHVCMYARIYAYVCMCLYVHTYWYLCEHIYVYKCMHAIIYFECFLGYFDMHGSLLVCYMAYSDYLITENGSAMTSGILPFGRPFFSSI